MHKDIGDMVGLFTLANDILSLEYEDMIGFPSLADEYCDFCTPACFVGDRKYNSSWGL